MKAIMIGRYDELRGPIENPLFVTCYPCYRQVVKRAISFVTEEAGSVVGPEFSDGIKKPLT